MKEIQLGNRRSLNLVSFVDDEDYEDLMKYRWHSHKASASKSIFYAETTIKCISARGWKDIKMHRLIMNPDIGFVVDHINGNGLDNRKCNLRLCKNKDNIKNSKIPITNTTGFKGVFLIKDRTSKNKYWAYIKANNKRYGLGMYSNPVDAARAYNEAALKYHGEFARLNEIPCAE